jgi:hypothetical protein
MNALQQVKLIARAHKTRRAQRHFEFTYVISVSGMRRRA